MTLDEFAQQQKLSVVVRDRHLPPGDPLRFYATFEPAVLLAQDGTLFACYGNGPTPEEARSALWAEIQGERLIRRDGGGAIDVAVDRQQS